MSRPRKPLSDDKKVNRRRLQYRISKRRNNERRRHEAGKCKEPCFLRLESDEQRVPVALKNGEGWVWLPA